MRRSRTRQQGFRNTYNRRNIRVIDDPNITTLEHDDSIVDEGRHRPKQLELESNLDSEVLYGQRNNKKKAATPPSILTLKDEDVKRDDSYTNAYYQKQGDDVNDYYNKKREETSSAYYFPPKTADNSRNHGNGGGSGVPSVNNSMHVRQKKNNANNNVLRNSSALSRFATTQSQGHLGRIEQNNSINVGRKSQQIQHNQSLNMHKSTMKRSPQIKTAYSEIDQQ